MTTVESLRLSTAAPRATTGIGSLPHHNVDAALEFSFKMGIPFLPQIPIRNPWEYMIAQALEGLPGLQADRDGSVTLNTDIWLSRASDFNSKLENAFLPGGAHLENFEPSSAISSSWQPFVWELQERGTKLAKIQIAGPMTSQWVLNLRDSEGKAVPSQSFNEANPELSSQIFRLVLARALAMSQRLKQSGIQPLLFLDEPGLYSLTPSNPRHVMAIQELKLLVQALRKEGVLVGIHCCSNTHWETVLSLPIHYLSLDVALSLPSLLAKPEMLRSFLTAGGRLSLGVIPTGRSNPAEPGTPEALRAALAQAWGDEPSLIEKTLHEAIYTPACGLALQSTAEAERILESLTQFEMQVNAG
jgi:hypothetical protein